MVCCFVLGLRDMVVRTCLSLPTSEVEAEESCLSRRKRVGQFGPRASNQVWWHPKLVSQCGCPFIDRVVFSNTALNGACFLFCLHSLACYRLLSFAIVLPQAPHCSFRTKESGNCRCETNVCKRAVPACYVSRRFYTELLFVFFFF